MLKHVIALVVALLLNAAANLMIRFGMRAIDLELGGAGFLDGGLGGIVRLLLRHWVVLLGIGCFAANVVFYSFALQKLPISAAYPIMVTGGFAIIVIVASSVLGERLTAVQWVGVGAIMLGVLLVARDLGTSAGPGEATPPASSGGAALPTR